ncbi:MAG: CHAT domain-containing protein, partial [Desulfomonilaceae bacterium]
MTRFLVRVAVVVLAVCLLPALGSAQSMEQASKLIDQGRALRDNSKSKSDMELALQKFQSALAIYEKVRSQKGQGVALHHMARAYQASGQSQKALEYFEKSLALFKKSGEHKGEGVTLDYIGQIYFAQGQHQRALEYYEKGLAMSRKARNIKHEGIALNNIALVYQGLGQNEKAVDYFEQSLIICRKAGNTESEQTILSNVGVLWRNLGQYQKVIEAHEKQLDISRKIREIKGEGEALHRLGQVHAALGEGKKALEFFEQALHIAQKVGNERSESDALNDIGEINRTTGNFAKALDCYQKSLEIDKKTGLKTGRLAPLNNMAVVYKHLGQYQTALEQFQNVIEAAQKTRDAATEAAALVNMAGIYTDLGQHQKALEILEKSLQMGKKLGHAKNQFYALFEMASAYESLGQYDKALAHYVEAAKGSGKSKETNYRIGLLYLAMGDIPTAETFLKKDSGQIEIFAGARIAIAKLDFEKAVDPLKLHLNVSRQSRKVDGIFTGYSGLGLAYEGLRQYEAAAENYTQAIGITEEMRDGLTEGHRVNFFDARIDGIARLTPYEGLCRGLLHMGRLDEAFKQAESTKARIFSESLSRRAKDVALDVPVNMLEKDSDINNRLAAQIQERTKTYEKSAHWLLDFEKLKQYKDAEEKAKSLEKQIKELLLERDRHRSALRKEYPLFAATKYPQPMNLEESALKDHEWVLEYQVTDSGVAIFLIKGKKIIKGLFKAIERKGIDNLVRKFREPMELGQNDFVPKKLAAFDFESGKKLSDLLLADILPDLPKDTPVIIIPDGPLGVVPFEMLVLNDGGKVQTDKTIPYVTGADFFGDRNPISYYQSVTALTLARTLGKQQKAGDRTLAMVDPVFSPEDTRLVKAAVEKRRAALDKLSSEKLMSFKTELALEIPRLPLTTQLGESLKKADPAKTDLYEGVKAQKSELLQKDLKPYHSVVFATHGYFGKDLPGIQEPVLILTLPGQSEGQDGFLRMTEVMGLKMNCDVAALTACQTGLGRHISGEGTMGMGRAFQYAGA